MEWIYEATKQSGFFRAEDGEPLRYSVRRYRVVDLDTVEVDHSYRHGTSYDTSREARVAARALNMGKCSDCGSPLNSRGYCGNGMIKAVKR